LQIEVLSHIFIPVFERPAANTIITLSQAKEVLNMSGTINNSLPIIAVDAMGGDFAPEEIVKGAVQATGELGVKIILAGIQSAIEKELAKYAENDAISIVDAPDIIKDGEEPAFAVLRKRNNSIAVATRLVKEGKADAIVSAGSTGACMVCALQFLGTLPGIERPIAGGAFLGFAPNTVVMDLGANVGVKPYQLLNFAVAGSIYSRIFHGTENPTVGLLNVGAEEGKGNEQAKEAYKLLKNSGLNFAGNVEGMDIATGKTNVIVCDGFLGNVLVKYSEGISYILNRWIEKELKGTIADEALQALTGKLYRSMSSAVALGGGPLIGVNGISSIAHGSSRAEQIVGTIRNTKTALENGFVEKLRAGLEKAQASLPETA
jgi:glycerol-3-phosphate acyltransferase PlsX